MLEQGALVEVLEKGNWLKGVITGVYGANGSISIQIIGGRLTYREIRDQGINWKIV